MLPLYRREAVRWEACRAACRVRVLRAEGTLPLTVPRLTQDVFSSIRIGN